MPPLRFPSVARIALLAMTLAGGRAAHAGDIPVVVAQLANAYVALIVAPGQADDLRDQCARGFFLGFIRADQAGEDSRQPDVERRAFEAGHAYWRDHPRDRARIFSGCIRVTVEGTWTTGFELNDFSPAGIPDEAWTIDALGGPAPLAGGDLMGRKHVHDHFPVLIAAYVDARSDRQVCLDTRLHRRFALVTAIWPASGPGRQDPAQLIQFPGSM